MSDLINRIYGDFDKKNEVTKHKTDLADEITQALGINGVYVSVSLTNEEMHLNKLDFSDHDKVLEDKIELLNRNLNLQKDKRCEEEIERNYLAGRFNQFESEITSLKSHMSRIRERCMDGARCHFDNGNYGCLTIVRRNVDSETENKKLKQRIAELESKITEKPTKINLNDRIKVKLTPLGAEIYYHQYDEVNKQIKENGGTELEPMMPQVDKDGFTEFQLHHFISLYGEHIGMCKPNVINPLDIIITE